MELREEAGQSDGVTHSPALSCECAALRRRLQRMELEIRRLARCIELKDQKLCELRSALANSATVHYRAEERLQCELDTLRINAPAEMVQRAGSQSDDGSPEYGVMVRLPYMTMILSVLFDAMRVFWADCDHHHLPKSSTVARAIDERLGLGGQANGEASRTGQAYASAIRPDWVKEADNRHHRRTGEAPRPPPSS
ncbi:conserved protein of unknown function [Paraburkholderia kururiensis]|uniref:hypothetical protein n=1 Tax=Paraburkholderia kururiensis TaxID=984307 RepID=UPI0039A75869